MQVHKIGDACLNYCENVTIFIQMRYVGATELFPTIVNYWCLR